MGNADQLDGEVGGEPHAGAFGQSEMESLSRFLLKLSSQRQVIVLLAMVLTTITMHRPPGMEETKKWSHWKDGGVPEGMDLARGIGEQRAEGALVQGGEDDPGHGQAQGDLAYAAASPAGKPIHSKKDDRYFGDLHGEVGGDVPGDQEQHRGGAEGDHHRVGEPPGLPEVDHQVNDGEEVAEQTVQQRQPLDRLQVVPAEDLARGAELEAGGGERHHGEQPEAEKQAPGVVTWSRG